MAEQYAHTLIAKPKEFVPSSAQVQSFLSAMVAQGVVPELESIDLRTPSGKTREYQNPFTDGTIVVELKDHTELRGLDQIAKAAASLSDYEIGVAGLGKPRTPPLPINCKEPYYVSVTCFVSSKLRSTSDLHEGSGAKRTVVPYREPCPANSVIGFFSSPRGYDIIEVPGAGYARFWVEFELGKFLFPEIAKGSLDLLNPVIVTEAQQAFGISFVQGCFWGE